MMATRHAPSAARAPVTTAMGAPRVPGFDVPMEGPPPPVAEPRNAFKAARQDAKVAYIVITAEDFARDRGQTLAELITEMEGWSQSSWNELALAGGQRPPSEESQARVLTRLRARASKQTEAPPAAVLRFFVWRQDPDAFARKYAVGEEQGYASKAEAVTVRDERKKLGQTGGNGFTEDVWIEERRVRA